MDKFPVITNKCRDRMKYFNLTKDDIIHAFKNAEVNCKFEGDLDKCVRSYPQRGYELGIIYGWNEKEGRHVLVTCWKHYI